MTSGGGMFSAEEIAYLKTLPAVADATAKRITYTEEFKIGVVQRYVQGESPVEIFREAGLEPALIGYKRIECAVARWRKVMGVPTNNAVRQRARARRPAGCPPLYAQRPDTRMRRPMRMEEDGGDIRDLLIYQQVRRIDELERQVQELSAQLKRAKAELREAQRRDTASLRVA